MLSIVPLPQEIAVDDARWRPRGELKVFETTAESGDALREVLESALDECKKVTAVRWTDDLTPPFGDTGFGLAIAADSTCATELIGRAETVFLNPLPAQHELIDGVYMSEAMSEPKPVSPAGDVLLRNPEAYALVISRRGAALVAPDRRGLFYGVQTLVQILRADDSKAGVPAVRVRDWPTMPLRGIQIDMKYMLHDPAYLAGYLRRMATLKLNCALFEYEDKFPFEQHPFLRAASAMTPEELRDLLAVARRHHITVIPLVQTLGHLEFALKHEELRHVRETPEIWTQICPSNAEAQAFVRSLIDEIAAYHRGAPYMHIGGDETEFLGECTTCAEKAKRTGGPVALYIDHMSGIIDYVRDKGFRPILWDDIVRRDLSRIKKLPTDVVLCYWVYATVKETHGPRKLPEALAKFYDIKTQNYHLYPDTLSFYPLYDFYREHGFDVIGAPAFTPGTLVPNQDHATLNTATWATKTALCNGLGLINTQWACFRVPMETGWYGVAYTAESTWLKPSLERLGFDQRFSTLTLGRPDPSLVRAMDMASMGVGVRSSLGRPLHLLHFAYMDAVIHFAGDMRERQRKGGGHVEDLDYARILRAKLELTVKDGKAVDARSRLDRTRQVMKRAAKLLGSARGRREEYEQMIALCRLIAEFKAHRAEMVDALLGSLQSGKDLKESKRQKFAERERAFRDRFKEAYERFLPPAELEENLRMLFEGEMACLQD